MATESDIAVEEPWNEKIENLIHEWKDLCRTKAKQHELAGYDFKRKNTIWGLPPVIVPIIMSPLSAVLESECDGQEIWKGYFTSTAFLIAGFFSGVYSFFGFGKKMEKHFSYSARYSDIVTEIEAEMIKETKWRIPADVFMTKIKMNIENLSGSEPVLPAKFIDSDDTATNRKLDSFSEV